MSSSSIDSAPATAAPTVGEFPLAPMSQSLRRSTLAAGLVVLVCATLPVALIAFSPSRKSPALGIVVLSALLGPMILWLVARFAPRTLRLGADGSVTVVSRASERRFVPTSVEPLSAETLRRSFRSGGAGGVVANYGHYRCPALGAYLLYATRSEGYVLLRATPLPVVVTPAEPEGFVAAWQAAARR